MPPSRLIRRKLWDIALTLLAAAAPVVIVLPVVISEARQQAAGEASTTANVVRHQIDNILLRAEDATRTLTELLDKPCSEVLPMLQQMGTLRPYFRSLLLIRDKQVYCSSLFSGSPTPLYALSTEGELPQGLRIVPVSGTLLVPDRPAVQVSTGVRDGLGALAFVDAQYLYDLKGAAARNGLYDIEILLGKGREPLLDGDERSRDAHPVTAETQVSLSATFPVEVRVTVLNHQIDSFRRDIWRNYLAFLVLACLVCGYLAHRFYGRRISLVSDMRKGMRRGEFHLVYQPIVNLATSEFSGVEALVRWKHPTIGVIRPDLFIPVAEDQGLIAELTRHIFNMAAADLPLLNMPAGCHLGINVCGAHMAETGFVADIERLQARLNASTPVTLVLEITERDALPDSQTVRDNMTRLRERGVLWAIDDFGTGHSSLAYLERLNADFLKIDRAFVNGVGTDAITAVVLDTVINLAKRLDLAMIAEGIETEEQAEFLRRNGVQWAQGYHFARPMPARELAAWRKRTPPLQAKPALP